MRLLDFFKKKQPSATVAKERLQILVSHERAARGAPSWLGDLKNDILEVVKKYVEVEPEAISFKVGREENRELLELNIALPGGVTKVKAEVTKADATKADATKADAMKADATKADAKKADATPDQSGKDAGADKAGGKAGKGKSGNAGDGKKSATGSE